GGRARRHLRPRPDRRSPRPLPFAAPAFEAAPPAGQCRSLRRLQRQTLGAGNLSGGAQSDTRNGIGPRDRLASSALPGNCFGPRLDIVSPAPDFIPSKETTPWPKRSERPSTPARLP